MRAAWVLASFANANRLRVNFNVYWSPWVLYWSLFVLAFGACVGSFLNVVIYRWPRDLSIREPLWSFCPHCRATLGWYDNLPVFSYARLRGRCRYCRAPISLQYPLVELATAFSFLIIYDAFFVARLRDGITDIAVDWPVLLAHWGLAAGLIVLTVMDLEAYLVDIRATWIMSGLGLLLYALWTPAASTAPGGWIRPGVMQALMAVGAAVGLLIGGILLLRRYAEESEVLSDVAQEPPAEPCNTPSGPVNSPNDDELLTATQPVPAAGLVWVWALVGVLLVAGYVGVMVVQDYQATARLIAPPQHADGRLVWPEGPRFDPGVVRTLVGLAALFVSLVLLASHPHPEQDEEIIESINAEAVDARRNALYELKLLAPAILLMVVAMVLVLRIDGLSGQIDRLLHWRVAGQWQPLLGLATALVGWVIGGALAWATRLLGTLCLGKEALGMGDVHIMAAVGAMAGWSVAFIGFFLASFLALAGMTVIHLRRQSRAVPYGPWLALGSFVVVLFQDRLVHYLPALALLK